MNFQYLIWFFIGASFTILDEIHIYYEIMDHSTNIISQNFPSFFSPSYGLAGLIFFILYQFFFLTKGKSLITFEKNVWIYVIQTLIAVFCYFLTGLLCGKGNENTWNPFYCSAIILLICHMNAKIFTDLRRFLFCCSCALIGCGFEWIMGHMSFGFKHGLCPSFSCLGTNISLSWLPFLYFCSSCFMMKVLKIDN